MKADLAYAYEEVPERGALAEVVPGVFWVRMPMPFALDHVNVWLLEDGDGWTVIDTGLGNDDTKALWRRILAGPGGGRPVRRVIATHFHADHVGLAGWFEQEHDAPVLMSREEWLTGRFMAASPAGAGAQKAAFYAAHGLPADKAKALGIQAEAYRDRTSPYCRAYTRLRAGDRIRIGGSDWLVLTGEGHSPEQVCLYSADLGLLISGDQILPQITPNISVQPFEPEADPLRDFLVSLRRFRDVPDGTLVLPSHGRPFRALHKRLDAIERHHQDRLADIEHACAAGPRTAFDLLPVIFRRPLDDHQLGFAMGEVVAHLAFLHREGRIPWGYLGQRKGLCPA